MGFSRELQSLMVVPLGLVVSEFRFLTLLLFEPLEQPADVGSRILLTARLSQSTFPLCHYLDQDSQQSCTPEHYGLQIDNDQRIRGQDRFGEAPKGESTGQSETRAAQKFELPRYVMTVHGDLVGDDCRDCARSSFENGPNLVDERQPGPAEISKELVGSRPTYVYPHNSLVLGFPHLIQFREAFIIGLCSLKSVQGLHQNLLDAGIPAVSQQILDSQHKLVIDISRKCLARIVRQYAYQHYAIVLNVWLVVGIFPQKLSDCVGSIFRSLGRGLA